MLPGMTTVKSIASGYLLSGYLLSALPLLNYICNDL